MPLTPEPWFEDGDTDAVNLGLQIVKLEFLERAKAGLDRNFAGSPLSLTFFLSLLASGSKGDIKDRLLASLGSKNSDELYQKSFNLLSLANSNEDSSKNSQGPFLLMNSSIWVDQSFSLKPAFQHVIDNFYKSEIRFLDFQNKGLQQSQDDMNK
ncbi:Serpin family [Corchorus capsularis]|uniref:Serpin family n=1 Tax=Corchorus capsularis TaxID=210143 RepID=A0A1R3IGP6_COCAP|nr:Serpin family [Corchorus capsularis]